MAALAAAVRPFAGGVLPRCATPAPCDVSERASGTKPRRVALAPARNSSVCLAGVEELYVASQKRNMACNRNNVETAAADTKVLTVGGEMSARGLLRKRKMTCNRNSVVETAAADTKVLTAAAGGMPARELLQKRLASELDVLRGLLKKAEVISRRGGARNGGAPAAGNGNKERFLASNSKQRPEPMEDGGGNAPSVMKRTKISAPVEQRQKQVRAPPRMSAEERRQLACRLSSLSGEVPGHIVEFLLNHVGDADDDGEIEIDIDSVEDSVLIELKTQLDKFAPERPIVVDVLPDEKDEKLAEKSKSEGILVKQEEEDVHICGVSTIVQTGSKPSSRSSSGSDKGPSSRGSSGSDKGPSYSACERYSDGFPAVREALPEQIIATSMQPPWEPAPGAARSGEAKKAQDVQRAAAPKTLPLAGLINRAKFHRELMEMEKMVLPDERIHPRDLQRLGIAEYGHPSLMRQLGLVCGLSPIVETGSTPSRSSSSGDSGSYSDPGNDSDSDQIMDTSARQPSEPASGTAQSTVQAESVPGIERIGGPAPVTVEVSEVARDGEAKKVQEIQLQRAAPKASVMPGLLYKANLHRELLEMERAALPDQSIHPRDLQRLGIAEYGHPSLMRQLGLVLKADDA